MQSSTRSVAILDPIQYGVGRMDMTINALAATLYDKKGEAYTPDAAGFTVTGVLIGGQKRVNYDFTTNTSATERAIYDNITKSQAPSTVSVTTTSNSATNYTLALQTAPETPIYVAIELLNNGADFEGVDGVIPAGCKFYLVGKLDPTADGTYDTYNTAANVSYTGKRVFMQDFKTIVNFTIVPGTEGTANDKGLGAAYNTIPDLRTPELELGLSVNLEWQPGITFTVNL